MHRAAALGEYRVGAPLRFADLRFARSNSAVTIALAAWLAQGSPETSAAARATIPEVEAFCTDTGYPQTRFDAATLAAAELLRRVSHGDIAEMGSLLAQAVPPRSRRSTCSPPGPELTGRVIIYRWPAGGPPEIYSGRSGQPAEPQADTARARICQQCGKPLNTDGPRRGRPATYCSGACRTAAHRALHRTAPRVAGRCAHRSPKQGIRRAPDTARQFIE